MTARLHSIGLKVVDYAKMKAFYEGVLGFRVARSFEEKVDHKACFFELDGGLFYIIWDEVKEGEQPLPAKTRCRLDIHVPDIEEAWKSLSAQVPGAKGPPHPTRWGGFGFSIKDPEGTVIHVLQGKK
jgi:catechol 2,3-dioxygenase-like lactoylglutathione lyase family enzyme